LISRRKGFLILALIFGSFLSSLGFLLLGDTEYKSQPVFGELDAPFNIVDFKGDTISSCNWNDKIILYNFLSVECPTDFEKCPFRLEWFKIKIYNELVDNIGFDDVIVVTSFLESSKDINYRIKEFRDFNKIDSEKWIMTASKYIPYFDNEFTKGNPWTKKDTIFGFDRQAHLMTLLVDKNQKIRGKYFTYNFGEIRRITKEISLLLKEEQENSELKDLPIYGNKDFDSSIDKDTLYHQIPEWSFENQNSQTISSEELNKKVKLVDFFFTSCPTICPQMTLNMRKIQSSLKKNCLTDVELLSFTVDPLKDTSEQLLVYANSYNVDSANWNMLTGDQSTIYDLGVNGFLVPNQEDALAPGGFLHSEKLILVDQFNRIRGYYDGTDSLNIPIIVQHIQSLL
jgi:protein SCO1|tara:strand:+ start:2474 stop:3670 length:1197 start_codon:yes stop_codon:yes gene_type:complete